MSEKRVLFVSHNASMTGAPMVLLHLLEWLKERKVLDLTVYLKDGGDLEDKFHHICRTYLPHRGRRLYRGIRKVVGKVVPLKDSYQLPKNISNQKFDLIYINTVDALRIVSLFRAFHKGPIICHIHENEFSLNYNFPDALSKENIKAITHFIAVSHSTKNNLVYNYGINSNDISIAYEFISIEKVKQPTQTAATIKEELGFKDEFVVGGAGMVHWRKGADLFIRLAQSLKKLNSANDIKLLWVGNTDREFDCQAAYEVKRLGVEDMVVFCGKKSVPQNYFQIFDVFALTSREDPFPLVALEAGSLGVPIICFKDSGGIPELLATDKGGAVVDYSDYEKMARKIVQYKNDGQLRNKVSNEAKELIKDYDVSVIGPQILKIIQNHLPND